MYNQESLFNKKKKNTGLKRELLKDSCLFYGHSLVQNTLTVVQFMKKNYTFMCFS